MARKNNDNYGMNYPSYDQYANRSNRSERSPRWRKVAAALGIAAVPVAIVGGMKLAEMKSNHDAAERVKTNEAIEKTIKPTMEDIGSRMLAAKQAETTKDITMEPTSDGKHVELKRVVTDTTGAQREIDVIMGMKDGKADPASTSYVSLRYDNNSKDLPTISAAQLATREGSSYVKTVSNDYKDGDAYASLSNHTGKTSRSGFHNTANLETEYYDEGSPFGSVEGAANEADKQAEKLFAENMAA